MKIPQIQCQLMVSLLGCEWFCPLTIRLRGLSGHCLRVWLLLQSVEVDQQRVSIQVQPVVVLRNRPAAGYFRGAKAKNMIETWRELVGIDLQGEDFNCVRI
ncbi:MAG: hypothetical protein ABGZ17_28510 [Planctomycetaceae bacterium]